MVKGIPSDNRIVKYFRETLAELRKVVWPTREEAIRLTAIVVAAIFAMAAFFGAIDWALTQLFALLFRK